jgi:hypothetical protein
MASARSTRTHARTSKFGRRRRRSGKRSATLWRARTTQQEEITRAEGIPSLLFSSLRYWEVERDLIEERLAAIASPRISR